MKPRMLSLGALEDSGVLSAFCTSLGFSISFKVISAAGASSSLSFSSSCSSFSSCCSSSFFASQGSSSASSLFASQGSISSISLASSSTCGASGAGATASVMCTSGTSKYDAGGKPSGTTLVISVPSGASNVTLVPGRAISGTRTMSTGGLTSNSSPAFLPGGTVTCRHWPPSAWSVMRSPSSSPSGTLALKPSLGPSRTFTRSPVLAPAGTGSWRGPWGPSTQAERVCSCRISGTSKQMSRGGVHCVRMTQQSDGAAEATARAPAAWYGTSK
mmetsp:Transcript_28020/g.74102  ORF Transcript_28020/g.74102 Transcript_28020/m.74102 type:complete len:273 (+) Transcript_28020:240-1058(+)